MLPMERELNQVFRMKRPENFLGAAALVAGVFGFAATAQAQADWPESCGQFTLIGNFAPGGVVGLAMQDFQPYFEQELGIRVAIETIEGAAGLIGYNSLYARPADGCAIIPSSSTFGPYLYPHLSQTQPPWQYEEWLPLGIYSDIPNSGMVVLKDSPYQTFPDFIAAAKADPGGITVGTIGPGRVEDVQIVELQEFFGVEVNHVYYDSGGTLFTDLLTGDLDIIVTASIQYADNPDVTIMTLLAKAMTENFPYKDIPTLADHQEVLGYDVNDLRTLGTTHFNGMMVKAGLPDETYGKLAEVFRKVVTNPEWQERVASYRFPVYYTPEEATVIYDGLEAAVGEMIQQVRSN
jgi:tripartite-type tricarboxylate transporter receptor subunit TctC